MDGGGYRGTVALNVPVPRSDRELVLVALDMWERACELHVSATIDRAHPFWLPGGWLLTTDAGTSHSQHSSGGGTSGWHFKFDPALPDDARELRVHIGADSQPGDRRSRVASIEPTVVVPLVGFPPQAGQVVATAAAPPPRLAAGASGGGTPGLDGVPVGPERVVPISSRFDHVVGRDVCITFAAVWRDFFYLRVGGSGAMPQDALPRRGDLEPYARWANAAWHAEDDVGGHYVGRMRGGHHGFPWFVTAQLHPALDPAARSLQLQLPDPFGAGSVATTVTL